MNSKIERAIISVVVFIVIYILCNFLEYPGYDMYVQAFRIMTAVIGAGCYWIGSNEKEK